MEKGRKIAESIFKEYGMKIKKEIESEESFLFFQDKGDNPYGDGIVLVVSQKDYSVTYKNFSDFKELSI